jgi:hypothetical protein
MLSISLLLIDVGQIGEIVCVLVVGLGLGGFVNLWIRNSRRG